MSIRLRVFLAFLILVGAGIGYQLHWTFGELKPEFREALEDPLIDLAEVLAAEAAGDITDGRLDPSRFSAGVERVKQRKLSAQIYSRIKTEVDLRLILLDSAGLVLYDSLGSDVGKDYSKWNDVARTLRGEYGARATRANLTDPESSTLFVSAPVISAGLVAGVVSVGKPAAVNNSLVRRVRKRIWTGSVATLVGALVLSVLITTWVSLPVKRLTEYARSIKDRKRIALPSVGSGEMLELRDSFEEMRVELEGRDYVANYVQALTHELKSPIAAIQGAAQLLQEDLPIAERDRFLENIVREVERMRQGVDRLLALAAIERMDQLPQSEKTDLRAIAQKCINLEKSRYTNRGISVNLESGPPVVIRGNPELIEQAVSNLISNAVDFSDENSNIEIFVGPARKSGFVELTCLDNGSGFPDYARERLFERFYSLTRPNTGVKSSGIGLSIVKEVMQLHGGSVEIENRPEGGVSARLLFPDQA